MQCSCKQSDHVRYAPRWLTANPEILADAVVKNLATQYQRTSAQVFFRYLSQMDIVPLTGTTLTDHMQQDLAIFEFELTTDECKAIGELLEE